MDKHRFKKGDIIKFGNSERLIVEAKKNSYVWKYLDIEKLFYSQNSNDPLFTMLEWKKVN